MSLPLTIAALTLAALLLPPRRPAVAPPAWRSPAGAAPQRRPPGVVLRVWRSVRTRLAGAPAVDPDELELLTLVEAIAPGLRAGLTPADALRAVQAVRGGGQSVLDDVVGLLAGGSAAESWSERAAAPGCRAAETPWDSAGPGAPPGPEPTPAVGRTPAAAPGSPGPPVSGLPPPPTSRSLLLLSTAWALGEETGAPMAATAEAAAAMLRESIAHERRVAVVLAGPRATVRLLTALPVTGLLLAGGVGIPPADLVGSPAAVASLALGLFLVLLGRVWVARLVDRVRAGPP